MQVSRGTHRGYQSLAEEMDLADTGHELQAVGSTFVRDDDLHLQISRDTAIEPSRERVEGCTLSEAQAQEGARLDRPSIIDPRQSEEEFVESIPYKTPIERPDGYPELKYKPLLLRRRLLIPLLIFYISCFGFVAALVALNTFAPSELHIRKSVAHDSFNYVPSVLGSITTVTFRSLVSSYGRLLPFLTMSTAGTTAFRQKHDTHSTNTILIGALVSFQTMGTQGIKLLRYGHYLTFSLFWSRIIINLSFASLKAALIRVSPDSHGWQVSISNGVGYALMVIYAAIIVGTLAITIRTWDACTGLKWDPTSYAAQIALLQNSSLPTVVRALDLRYSATANEFMDVLKQMPRSLGPLRLGYWHSAEDETKVMHGIDFVQDPENPVRVRKPPRLATEAQNTVDHNIELKRSVTQGSAIPFADFSRSEYKERDPEYRRFYCANLMLSDSVLLFGFVTCCGLVAAFVHWINSGRLKTGWMIEHRVSISPPLSTQAGDTIIAVIPAAINSLLSAIWFNADLFYRTAEPLAGMATPQLAQENILLDYVSPDPVSLIASALGKWHWRVAYFALLPLVAPYMSVFAVNIFQLSRGDEVDHLRLVPTNFYVSIAALSYYGISFVLVRPSIRYRFPRTVLSISDLLSYCCDSSIMTASEFSVQEPDDHQIHLQSQIYLAKRKYLFGFYRGKDGQRHLGFDADEFYDSPAGKAASVHAVIPGKLPLFPFRKPWWIESSRYKSCRPRLALIVTAPCENGIDAAGTEGFPGLNSNSRSFATAHEIPDDGESDDEYQLRPIQYVDTLSLEAGLSHSRRPSQPAAGSSGVRRFQQSHNLQYRAPVDEYFGVDSP